MLWPVSDDPHSSTSIACRQRPHVGWNAGAPRAISSSDVSDALCAAGLAARVTLVPVEGWEALERG
ncbi:hypothetical protein ABNQ38_33100 [Azospirillum sp. A29]|jgi:hypothetical protein|uniref:hypothetical protein n=1 Tax=Azospirillum sp. A29 TaxID=3160606 RepID=UPI00366E9CFF